MAKRSPRLIFTEKERALPELERAVRKADRAAVKLEKAEAKIPKKTVKVKKRVVDSESGKVITRLFLEADKKRPPSKLAHAARKAPLDTVRSAVHRKLREEGDDNPGTEAANTLAPGICREVKIKSGRFNQHISTGALLIEIGNNRNTLSEALAACPIIAEALERAYRARN